MNHIFVATGIPSDSIRSDLALESDSLGLNRAGDSGRERIVIQDAGWRGGQRRWREHTPLIFESVL